MGIATDLILLVVTAFFSGLLMQRLGQPLILGYILKMLISFGKIKIILLKEVIELQKPILDLNSVPEIL